jgi:hypothetical protein
MHPGTHNEPRQARQILISLFLAFVYLVMYISHDLVFLTPTTFHQGSNHASLERGIVTQEIKEALHHNCPFCSGFIDTHGTPAIVSDDFLPAEIAPSTSVQRNSFTPDSKRSRAPPA